MDWKTLTLFKRKRTAFFFFFNRLFSRAVLGSQQNQEEGRDFP